MEKSRILILGKLPPPYFGPAIATEIILNSCLKEKFNLIHFNTQLNRLLEGMGKFEPGKPFKIFYQYFRFIHLLLKNKGAIVLIPISQTTGGFIKDSVFTILSRLIGLNSIIQLRGSNLRKWFEGINPALRFYVKAVIRMNSAAIVLGNNLTYIFKDLIPQERIFVIPNGSNYPELDKKIKYKNAKSKVVNSGILNTQKEKKNVKILYLANFLPSKGILEVIKAVRFISYPMQLDAVGEWLDEKIKNTCRDLTMNSKNIRFFPPANKNQKLDFLADADIFVFPPNKPEGHPWVIVEALAAGLPIISTDQGAIIESVIDGWNGFIVESNNPKQITEKLKILIENEELREEMGRNSRKHYEENFTKEKMVERLTKVFNTVLEER